MKKLILGVLLTVLSIQAQAVTVNGTVGTAGSGAAATDIFFVMCGAGNMVAAKVIDLAPVKSPILKITTMSGTIPPFSVHQVTDTIDGDTIFSPVAKAGNGGANIKFLVLVEKPAYTGTATANLGAETYQAQIWCTPIASNTVLPVLSITTYQNQ